MHKKRSFQEAMEIFKWRIAPEIISKSVHEMPFWADFFFPGWCRTGVSHEIEEAAALPVINQHGAHTWHIRDLYLPRAGWGNVSLMFSLCLWPALGKRWSLQDLRLTCSNTINLIHLCLPFIYTPMYPEEEGHVFLEKQNILAWRMICFDRNAFICHPKKENYLLYQAKNTLHFQPFPVKYCV